MLPCAVLSFSCFVYFSHFAPLWGFIFRLPVVFVATSYREAIVMKNLFTVHMHPTVRTYDKKNTNHVLL